LTPKTPSPIDPARYELRPCGGGTLLTGSGPLLCLPLAGRSFFV
jgi:hypothetical protein